jgi:hypothetical protein
MTENGSGFTVRGKFDPQPQGKTGNGTAAPEHQPTPQPYHVYAAPPEHPPSAPPTPVTQPIPQAYHVYAVPQNRPKPAPTPAPAPRKYDHVNHRTLIRYLSSGQPGHFRGAGQEMAAHHREHGRPLHKRSGPVCHTDARMERDRVAGLAVHRWPVRCARPHHHIRPSASTEALYGTDAPVGPPRLARSGDRLRRPAGCRSRWRFGRLSPCRGSSAASCRGRGEPRVLGARMGDHCAGQAASTGARGRPRRHGQRA